MKMIQIIYLLGDNVISDVLNDLENDVNSDGYDNVLPPLEPSLTFA